jgi:phage baseplate assembly protein V
MFNIRELANRVLHLVSRGRLQFVDDSASVQKVQVRVIADVLQDNVPRLAEYGFQSSPPPDSDAVLLYLAGNPSDGVVIATGNQQFRLRSLKSGEVAISDNQGRKVYLSDAGIRIEGASSPIQINTSSTLTINASGGATLNGNLAVVGNTTFTGQVSANGHRIDETHKHTGGTISGLTGTVL